MSAWPEWKRDNCTVTVSCCDMKKKELRAHARYHLWLQSRTATWWGLVTIVDVKDKNWETNKRMKSKFWSTFSKLFLNESMKDEKKLEKNIFQDLRGPVTVPNEDKVSYWLRRRRRENASEKTFFVPRPQRPLRFRTIPPLLFPALYALPALIGKSTWRRSQSASFSSQEWELAWLSSAQDRSMGQPCPHLLLLVTLICRISHLIFFLFQKYRLVRFEIGSSLDKSTH